MHPDSRDGISKAFGEAVGAFYFENTACASTCQIGNFGEAPLDKRRLSIWLKPEDLVQLVDIGLTHPDIRFEIFYGASNNIDMWRITAMPAASGYKPAGKSEDFVTQAMAAQAKLAADPVVIVMQGGTYASAEYDADKRSG